MKTADILIIAIVVLFISAIFTYSFKFRMECAQYGGVAVRGVFFFECVEVKK